MLLQYHIFLKMVKNTHGGSKHKSQARKASNTNNNLVIEPTSPLEKYAKVTKMYGNGMCQVETQDDNTSLLCHIRGKFRGKNKKHNSISLNAVVVIGLRDWESQQKNCDLIGVVSAGSNTEFVEDIDSCGFTFGNETQSNEMVAPQAIPEMDDFDIDDI